MDCSSTALTKIFKAKFCGYSKFHKIHALEILGYTVYKLISLNSCGIKLNIIKLSVAMPLIHDTYIYK